MKATFAGVVVAESDKTIVIEGNHYFPAGSLIRKYFKDSNTITHCPWKGEAHYYDVVVGDKTDSGAAWYYPTPKETAAAKVGQDFSGYVAFWKNVIVS